MNIDIVDEHTALLEAQVKSISMLMKSNSQRWLSAVDLILDACGLSQLSQGGTEHLSERIDPGSLAGKAGFTTLGEFVQSNNPRIGLGMAAGDFKQALQCAEIARRYDLRDGRYGLEALLAANSLVEDYLGRAAMSANEWHTTHGQALTAHYETQLKEDKAKIELLSSAEATMQERLSELKAQLSEVNTRLSKAVSRDEFESLKHKEQRISVELEALKTERSELSGQLEHFKSTSATKAGEVSALREQLDEAERERDDAIEKHASLTTKHSDLQARHSRLVVESEELRKEHDSLTETCASLESQIISLQEQQQLEAGRSATIERRLREQEEENAAISKQLEEATSSRGSQTDLCDRLRRELKTLQAQLYTSVERANAAADEKYQGTISSLRAEIKAQNSHIENLEAMSECDLLLQEADALFEGAEPPDDLTKRFRELSAEHQRLESDYASALETIDTLRQREANPDNADTTYEHISGSAVSALQDKIEQLAEDNEFKQQFITILIDERDRHAYQANVLRNLVLKVEKAHKELLERQYSKNNDVRVLHGTIRSSRHTAPPRSPKNLQFGKMVNDRSTLENVVAISR